MQERDRAIHADRHADAVDGRRRLRRQVRVVAVIGEDARDQRTADAEADLQAAEHRRENDRGGAAVVLPLRVVGDVGDHRPQQRNRDAVEEAVQDLRGEDQADRVRRIDVEREQEQRGEQQRAAEHVPLAEAVGQGLGEADADDHADDAAGVEQAEGRGRRVLRPLELGQPHAGQHRVEPADEGVEADVVQERGQRRLAQVVLEVVDVHATLEREGDEHQDRECEHHQPGLVAQQVGQVLPRRWTSAPAPAPRARGW